MNIFGRGASINVVLSQEQIEDIASVTADKVNTTKDYYVKQLEWTNGELERVRYQLAEREKLITQQLLQIDRYRIINEKIRKNNKELKEKLGIE